MDYYFSDANLKRDHFFQKEIAKDPEGESLCHPVARALVIPFPVLSMAWRIFATRACSSRIAIRRSNHRSRSPQWLVAINHCVGAGFISMELLMRCNKLKQLTSDTATVVAAIATSEVVSLSEDKTKVLSTPQPDSRRMRKA